MPSTHLRTLAAAVSALLALGCNHTNPEPQPPSRIAKAARDAALAHGRVWQPPATPIGRVDLGKNPDGPGAFRETDDVACEFVLESVGGSTPKFRCRLPGGETVKVKYGETNMEIAAEVAATRLLSALGFATDRMYLVNSVRCFGCPPFPFEALQCVAKTGAEGTCTQGADRTRAVQFPKAAIERPLAGRKIESTNDEGWAWFELDHVDPADGGASRAEVDALRLMAVFLAHWDNKAENQRLVCLSDADSPAGCRAPRLVVQDLGATFGPLKIDLLNWRSTHVWADRAACRVSMKTLPFGGGTFGEHRVSEEGRLLALTLLRQLSSDQLRGLFIGSGVTAFNHVLAAARDPDAWTAAFADKVTEIAAGGPCASGAELRARGE